MSDSVKGYIDHIVYRNEDNGYTVLVLKQEEGKELTCVGTFPDITQGITIEALGGFVEHRIYGEQFQITSYTEKLPDDAEALERYLGSGAIKGVGPALARRIVKNFGTDTLRIVEEEPERLSEIKGISEKKAREIAAQVSEKTEMRRAMIFLQKYGISLNLGARIYKKYGQSVYGVLQENPYKLAEDIAGVGFQTADEIAGRIGIQADSDYRIKSGLLYILKLSAGDGHMYLPESELYARTERLLGVNAAYFPKYMTDLAIDRQIIMKELGEEPIVYRNIYYHTELDTARLLNELNVTYEKTADKTLNRRIENIEKETGLTLDEIQQEAVKEAVERGLLIITGGPGTGKTTTINSIIRYFEKDGAVIFLAAPTGRAAKRITEATGYEAQTIHRMLGLEGVPEDDDNHYAERFEKNADNPLECDVLIIDEVSMVDIFLMHSLLDAVSIGTRLILVGDENQLPSVGPGNVLKDMIHCGAFKVVELKKIFRQAQESDIVVNAHKINKGEQLILDNKSRDFFFMRRADANVIIRVIIALISEKLPPYVHAKPYEIQVLTPMRKGLLGVERLNFVLQKFLNPENPSKREHEVGGKLFREGDKVMQIKNNYQLEWEIKGRYNVVVEKGSGIFNGDMGILKRLNTFAETAEVEFEDGRTAEYSFKQLDELELAYAITIHKSQGSEYPAVILPILTGPRMLLNRNLLYTAVTRAKKCVAVIGSEETFNDMIRNEQQQKRYSSLGARILEFSEEA